MSKKFRIFFAHSAGAQNGKEQGSFDLVAYLRSKLGEDYTITYPIVNEPDNPSYQNWKALFEHEFKDLSEPVIFVGHSLGGSVLLKYLSEEKTNLNITAMFLVAVPQWSADGWNVADFALRQSLVTKLPFIPELYFYHCIYDPVVPIAYLNFYRKIFKSRHLR